MLFLFFLAKSLSFVVVVHVYSARLTWVLLMLQHWAHSRNRPTATDEEKKKVFSILVVISLVGTISGKSLKLLPPDVIF